MRLVA